MNFNHIKDDLAYFIDKVSDLTEKTAWTEEDLKTFNKYSNSITLILDTIATYKSVIQQQD